MPFTFSHPAIVLPLLHKYKKYFSSTGLVIGSMIPDFEAFINISPHKVYGHTFWGMFWFDLPLGIIFAFTFHLFVRVPFIDNLPSFLRGKFWVYRNMDWSQHFRKHWIAVVSSTFIGIVSHLLWDLITHSDPFGWEDIYGDLNYTLQCGFSILGAIAIIYFLIKLPAKPILQKRNVYQYWALLMLLTICFFIIIIKYRNVFYTHTLEYLEMAISAFIYAIILQSICITVYRKFAAA